MNQENRPDEMISVADFSSKNGIPTDQVITQIRDGLRIGKVVNGQWYVKEEKGTPSHSKTEGPHSTNENPPGLTTIFYVLSGLSLLGGLVLAAEFWPGDPDYGMEWKSVAYVWSITWFMVAIVEAAIFAAIGKAIFLLTKIAKNTEK